MGLNYFIDTNVALYFLADRMVNPMPAGNLFLSVISEIELLSFNGLSKEEEAAIRKFVSELTVVSISNAIRDESIRIRREFGLRLPDAIIAASALVLHASLLTHDKQFYKVTALPIFAPL